MADRLPMAVAFGSNTSAPSSKALTDWVFAPLIPPWQECHGGFLFRLDGVGAVVTQAREIPFKKLPWRPYLSIAPHFALGFKRQLWHAEIPTWYVIQ